MSKWFSVMLVVVCVVTTGCVSTKGTGDVSCDDFGTGRSRWVGAPEKSYVYDVNTAVLFSTFILKNERKCLEIEALPKILAFPSEPVHVTSGHPNAWNLKTSYRLVQDTSGEVHLLGEIRVFHNSQLTQTLALDEVIEEEGFVARRLVAMGDGSTRWIWFRLRSLTGIKRETAPSVSVGGSARTQSGPRPGKS